MNLSSHSAVEQWTVHGYHALVVDSQSGSRGDSFKEVDSDLYFSYCVHIDTRLGK